MRVCYFICFYQDERDEEEPEREEPEEPAIPEKGFYISFDEDTPKRPKPPLRVKKASPKKVRFLFYCFVACREHL